MRVRVTRKRDMQSFRGVTSLIITKKGRLFSHVHVDVIFGEGATTHYRGKDHDLTWTINHKSNPGMGMDYCEKIEISEEVNV